MNTPVDCQDAIQSPLDICKERCPKRDPCLQILPFSSSAREETHIVCLPNEKMLEISSPLHEMLLLMDGTRSLEEIAARLSARFSKEFLPSYVSYILEQYFLPHGLVLEEGDEEKGSKVSQVESSATRGILFCPAKVLLPVTKWLRLLFYGPLSFFSLILIALSQIIIFDPSLVIGKTISISDLSTHDYILSYCLLLCSVLFHELGHLSACSYYGCKHGELRFGFYLIFPVFYSNVTRAWTLPRRARIVVDIGGIYFQMLLTIPCAFAYWLTGHPIWRYFCMAQVSMAFIAVNPFLRFDGYWIFSDLIGVANLRTRSRLYLKQMILYLLGRKNLSLEIFKIGKAEKIGLAFYSISSNLFFIMGFGLLLWYLPRRLDSIASIISMVPEKMYSAVHQWDISGMLAVLFKILIPCLLLLAMGRMLWYSVRGFVRFFGKILTNRF